MSRSKGPALLLATAVLTLAAAACLLMKKVEPRPRPFQQATGGIGLGGSVSVAWSFFLVDPRLESSCENELWPIPGLPCPNPYHGASISDPPYLAGYRAQMRRD